MQLRVLIPQWRFFDDPGANPQVYFKVLPRSEWSEAFLPLPRKVWHLFFNPHGNLRLLSISAFQRLVVESQDFAATPEAFAKSVSYRLCLKILEAELKSRIRRGESFQFKICAELSDGQGWKDAFISGVHSFES